MNLVIDAGNTTVKLAVFDIKTRLKLLTVVYDEVTSSLKTIFDTYPEISDVLLSSVGPWALSEADWLPGHCTLHFLDSQLKLPYKMAYGTPETLGKDRMALAAAAISEYPNQNVLVIDAGTCITYDLITADGVYLGGAISPGMRMRYRAMHEGTSALPKLDPEIPEGLIGASTSDSMHSGVVNGIRFEIEGAVQQYKTRFSDLTVILTGGDAHFLSKQLKNTIFAHSNFLLQGLNFLLEYNKS
ncbi:MAG: type III pantothenate kinase [Flavobacteriaceae bacterium]|nr:type III pantothenate kinase [Eudoraea sp.]NNJ38489.1 type III pantothenate kinase [Flavobacteriaceae bacterium]